MNFCHKTFFRNFNVIEYSGILRCYSTQIETRIETKHRHFIVILYLEAEGFRLYSFKLLFIDLIKSKAVF